MINKLLSIAACLLFVIIQSAEAGSIRYYFRTWDIRNGLSQNTVNAILQDRNGLMWMGTKDGLNRFDGLSFRVFKRENSALGNNFITALHESADGRIWIGTDGGVYVYDPRKETFEAFRNNSIKRAVTQISGDIQGHIWIASDDEGLFCYDPESDQLTNPLVPLKQKTRLANVTRFWFDSHDNTSWLGLYAENLYYSSDKMKSLHPFRDQEGKETFREDIINAQIDAPGSRRFIGSAHGLTEINLTTRRTRKLLNSYVRSLCLKSEQELWAGTEDGLYICHLGNGTITHIRSTDEEDAYALADNALYSLCRDREGGMWIGSYFGGVNYYPHQYTYFEKFYPHDEISYFGRRVREFCPDNDGTLWIGTEDKGLFRFHPETGQIEPFETSLTGKNIHGLCLDGNNLWVGTFSHGLTRIDLRTRAMRHYEKGTAPNTLPANDIFSICKGASGQLWIGTTSGLLRYNPATDDFTRIPELGNLFVYYVLEDHRGDLWAATYSNGLFRFDASSRTWKHFVSPQKDADGFLPYNKVISIFEDSRKRLWFMTQGAGFFRYVPQGEKFVRYDMSDGFPGNIFYRMVEDKQHNLWLTTNNGLVCFNPDKGSKRIYTTANGLLSNQFNYQSGYINDRGCIYLGSINGFIRFDPSTFVENTQVPPVRFTDIQWFNKRMPVGAKGSPLKEGITFAQKIVLHHNQNSFTLHVAALSYQAPEMNKLIYKLEGIDKEWHTARHGVINCANLPYGTYTLRVKGSNADGVWNPQECTLQIKVRPPFYLSGWACAVYILLVLWTAVGIVNYLRTKSRRRHQRAFEKLEHEKERELYTAKVDFFTNVAHEIRTPLTLIKSPLENVLATEGLPNAVRDDLEIMDLNTQRLLNLVNQLLDFRKTESKGFKLTFVWCDISELIHQTYLRFTPLVRQRRIGFTLECPKGIRASVDREAFTKIVSNLMNNAVKYTESYIHVCLSMKDSDKFCLTVSNDGKPIPRHLREEIFKPFIQYREGNANQTSGTGIGLALARSLAELHGGSLEMDSQAADNTFVLTLPLSHEQTLDMDNLGALPPDGPGEMQPENAPKAQVPKAVAEETQNFRYTILVTEDNAEMRAFLLRQLDTTYRVLEASNGVEALDILQQHTVNLVLSDVMMPEMDGYTLCDHIKSNVETSHIPVVLLTAKATLQAKIEGLKLGADAYIEKPFSMEYLKVVVTNLLENREKLHATFAHSPFVQTNSVALTKADEAFLKKLNDLVTDNMQNPDFRIDDIADHMNMSRSSLNRKIKGVLDMTPNDYLRVERLKRAAQLLREGECKINEICYMVGFNTPSYFTKCFLKQFGILPKDFTGNSTNT